MRRSRSSTSCPCQTPVWPAYYACAQSHISILFTRCVSLLVDITGAPRLVKMPKMAAKTALANGQIMLMDFLSLSRFRVASSICLRTRQIKAGQCTLTICVRPPVLSYSRSGTVEYELNARHALCQTSSSLHCCSNLVALAENNSLQQLCPAALALQNSLVDPHRNIVDSCQRRCTSKEEPKAVH